MKDDLNPLDRFLLANPFVILGVFIGLWAFLFYIRWYYPPVVFNILFGTLGVVVIGFLGYVLLQKRRYTEVDVVKVPNKEVERRIESNYELFVWLDGVLILIAGLLLMLDKVIERSFGATDTKAINDSFFLWNVLSKSPVVEISKEVYLTVMSALVNLAVVGLLLVLAMGFTLYFDLKWGYFLKKVKNKYWSESRKSSAFGKILAIFIIFSAISHIIFAGPFDSNIESVINLTGEKSIFGVLMFAYKRSGHKFLLFILFPLIWIVATFLVVILGIRKQYKLRK